MTISNNNIVQDEPDMGPYRNEMEALADEYNTLKVEYDNLNEQATLLMEEVAKMQHFVSHTRVNSWLGKWWKAYILRPTHTPYDVLKWIDAMQDAIRFNGFESMNYERMYSHLAIASAELPYREKMQQLEELYKEE